MLRIVTDLRGHIGGGGGGKCIAAESGRLGRYAYWHACMYQRTIIRCNPAVAACVLCRADRVLHPTHAAPIYNERCAGYTCRWYIKDPRAFIWMLDQHSAPMHAHPPRTLFGECGVPLLAHGNRITRVGLG